MNTIEIITRFRSRSLNAGQYIAYCKSLLSPIKKLFPQLHLYILDDKDKLLFFEEDLSNFDETHLYDIIMWDKRIAYHNPDKNKNSVADISISVSQGVEIFGAPAIILIDFSPYPHRWRIRVFVLGVFSLQFL